MSTREITTHSADETIAFGRTLTRLLAPPKLVLLRGDLGAGKTTLIKGIATGFEAASEEDVTSPTFTLVHGGVDDAIRIEMFGDLHQYGGLNGKLLTGDQARAALSALRIDR